MKHNMKNSSCFSPPKAVKQQQQRWFFWLRRRPASEGYSQKSNFQNLRHLYSVTATIYCPEQCSIVLIQYNPPQSPPVSETYSCYICFCPSLQHKLQKDPFLSPLPHHLLSNIFLTFIQSCGLFVIFLGFQNSSSLCAWFTKYPFSLSFCRAVFANG